MIKLEYIKGIKNTLDDTMSHLVKLNDDIQWELEEIGYEFGHYTFKPLPDIETKRLAKNIEKSDINATDEAIWTQSDNLPLALTTAKFQKLQQGDAFCYCIITMLQHNMLQSGHLYLIRDNILKRYVIDNKQTFKTTIMSSNLTNHTMKQAHDEFRHNISPRTCMFPSRLYYYNYASLH